MSPKGLILFCGLLTAIGAISIDILLPLFSDVAVGLHVEQSAVQLTIPVFALAMGLGQFFMGPLSDRFGRRAVVIGGSITFVIGAIVATLANNIEVLLFSRAIQGLGASVGQVVSRAILRDRYNGRKLASAMSLTFAIFAIGPIIAPLIGSLFAYWQAWRGAFIFMAAFGLVLLLFSTVWLEETIENKDPLATRPKTVWKNLSLFLGDRQTRHFLTIMGFSYVALFSFLVHSPLVYEQEFGVKGTTFGILFAATGIGIIIGQALNQLAIPRLGVLFSLRIASLIILGCGVSIMVLAGVGGLTLINLTALILIFNTSFLVVQSNSAAVVINQHKDRAGFASSMIGVVLLFFSTTVVSLTILLFHIDAFAWGAIMSAAASVCAVLCWSRGSRTTL